MWLATAGTVLFVVAAAKGQTPDAPAPNFVPQERTLPDQVVDKPSQPPAFQIPVVSLGFTGPGAFYLGQRISVASLDFLDDNRLLFTFRVPGLVHRNTGEGEERQIRAVVLKLPAGTVESEALWTVHDRSRYLWVLNGGRFLLRDRNTLEIGNTALELKPFLRFPGPLLWLEMDPSQQFLVTNSREAAAKISNPSVANQDNSNSDGQKSENESNMVVRILRRDSGEVMLVSRTSFTVHLPINSDGYLESVRGVSNEWLLNMKNFNGGSRIIGHVESSCSPHFDFLSQREVLVSTCTPLGTGKLALMTTAGRRLWDAETSNLTIWPLLVRSPDGLRLAREALAVSHPFSAGSTIDQSDIKGQLVEVLDSADGKVVLQTAASPMLDAGGNVAISPSGRRVAVLNGGVIQVFELAAPTPLLEPSFLVPEAHPANR